MAYIPSEHEKYDLLPRAREGNWEVVSYPPYLYEVDESLADIELGPRSEPGEARSSLLTPYGYKCLGDYLCVLDSYRVKYAHHPIADDLSRLSSRIVEMNRKEDWSVLRYIGPVILDTIFGLTPGRCYYWPTSTSFPFYDGVIDDEEFTSYASYSLNPHYWEILEDPTGMAADTMAGRRAIFSTSIYEGRQALDYNDLYFLHDLCKANAASLSESPVCGCFYCMKIFPSTEVSEFVRGFDGGTMGLCPYCGIDALLPSSSVEAAGFELEMSMLVQMERYWFNSTSRRKGSLYWSIPTSTGKLEVKLNGSPIPLKAFKDIFPRGEDYAVPFWSIDLDVSELHESDIVTVGIPGATFTYSDGDERCELLAAKAGDIHIGFCGYEPNYHGDHEALLHCFELVGFRDEGFVYEIVRDPSSCSGKFRHSTSIPLALCEIDSSRFAAELSTHYEDIGTALLFATSAHVC